mgnify:CR=1 FL=1
MLKITMANGTVIEASTIEELEAIKGLFVTEKAPRSTGMSKAETWEKNKADREADREEFFKTHKKIRSADENRALVYEAMGYVPRSGMYFDKALYKATAKKLGVLGKSGKVVGTYELIK